MERINKLNVVHGGIVKWCTEVNLQGVRICHRKRRLYYIIYYYVVVALRLNFGWTKLSFGQLGSDWSRPDLSQLGLVKELFELVSVFFVTESDSQSLGFWFSFRNVGSDGVNPRSVGADIWFQFIVT